MNPKVAARATAILLAIVVVFNLALLLGAPWGDYTQGGKDPGVLESPGRFGALGTAIFFAVLALAMLARAGEGLMRNWRPKVRTVLAWFTTLYLGLNCFLNVFTGPDAERTIFGPISTLTFVFAVITMSTTRRGYRPIG